MIPQALLGGSFDPIHNGHLHIAREILKSSLVSRIIFLPNARHHFKGNSVLLDFATRLELIQTALEPRMEVWDNDSSGSGFTSDLLQNIYAHNPGQEFLFVIGSDIVSALPRWHNYAWLKQHARFLIVPRPGFAADAKVLKNIHRKTLKMQPCPISSSQIRELIAAGKSISGLVPSELEHRILSLYTPLLQCATD